MTPGEIYRIDYPPPTSRVQAYQRPAVVLQGDRVVALQNDAVALRSPVVIAVPFTLTDATQIYRGLVVPVAPDATNNLTAISFALVHQIAGVDRNWFRERIGILDPASLRAIFAALDRILGRTPSSQSPPPQLPEPPDPPQRFLDI